MAAVAETYNYERPWLYPEQRAAIFNPKDAAGNPARISVIEASTKSGKTFGCIIWLFEQAFVSGEWGQNFWWVAPTYNMAHIAYTRLKNGIPRILYRSNDSDLTIKLANGSVIWFKSGEKPDHLFGEDVFAAVIDEASRLRQDAWHAIRTTLTATRGPLRIIMNVKGRLNWAYKLARRAQSGQPGYSYHHITAYHAIKAGVLEADEVEGARIDLPENVFKELYEAEPSDDEGNPFGASHIDAATFGVLSSGDPVAWGWDLGKSIDWTVGIALDGEGAMCRFMRYQRPWPETISDIELQTGLVHGLIDSTGLGDPIAEQIAKNGKTQLQGFKFSAPSKQQLMEGLAIAIQQGEIRVLEGVVTQELKEFGYEYTRTGVRYSAPEGMHDDTVCALALAVKARNERPAPVEAW